MHCTNLIDTTGLGLGFRHKRFEHNSFSFHLSASLRERREREEREKSETREREKAETRERGQREERERGEREEREK